MNMKTKSLFFAILIAGITSGGLLFCKQSAKAGFDDIQYPVAELGGCKDKEGCKTYCDKQENIKACVGFAEKNDLMPQGEIDAAKKFIEAGAKGPGGCTGREKCEAYCDDINNMDECVAFAEKSGVMSPQQLEEAKKVQAAIKKGIKPPPCKGKKECDSYCEDPNNMEECITFGAEAGFLQGKELEDSKKMLQALKKGVKPPPCKGKEACDAYCGDPNNMEKCVTFAIEAGFMQGKELEDSQKMLQALKKGVKPPTCNGKEECDRYCSEESHMEECMNFAEAAGFMTKEQADMARKTGGKGPGGCKGKEECEAFCNDPNNQETCFNFAKENGMIPEADLKRMEEGKQKFKETMSQMPETVVSCLKEKLGNDEVEKYRSGAIMPPRDIGDKMRECFEKNRPEPGQGGTMPPGDMMPPAGNQNTQGGPGGCKTSEECNSYCEGHGEECKNFFPAGQNGQTSNSQMAPGTFSPPNVPQSSNATMPPNPYCTTSEGCMDVCAQDPAKCGAPNSGSGGGVMPFAQPATGEQPMMPGQPQMAPGTMPPPPTGDINQPPQGIQSPSSPEGQVPQAQPLPPLEQQTPTETAPAPTSNNSNGQRSITSIVKFGLAEAKSAFGFITNIFKSLIK